MKLKTLKDVRIDGKTVIHRCDFNIKLRKNGIGKTEPVSNVRIKAYFPSIFYLINRGCKIVFVSWLERPQGQVVDQLRMKPVAERMSDLINREVKSLPELIGPKVRRHIAKMKPGEMVMLENTRFYPGEEVDDDRLARAIARNGQLTVFDAFGHAHRVHASTTGLNRHLPAVAGFYLQGEIETFDKLMRAPQKPLVLIVGGTKTHDKIQAIENLINKADYVLVGGALANNFLKARDLPVGSSFLEEPSVDKALKKPVYPVEEAKRLLNKYPKKIIIPDDFIAADNLEKPKTTASISLSRGRKLPDKWAYLDIGPKTIAKYCQIVARAKTVFWDGPMGVYEDTRFRQGTLKLAEAIADNKHTTILAGGDTAAVAENFGLIFRYSHVSIAGGATLQYLSGKPLPALSALVKK